MNIDTQKENLLEEKKLLEQELQDVAVQDKQNPGGYAAREPQDPADENVESDPNDLADQLEDFGNNNAITNDLEERLENVNKALDDIEKGTYGTCFVGGEPHDIEEDRLEALPSARTCKAHMD
tara:strand:- start:73 stop:441 length:369 start_codon:yes stop_codon:yes gene_type:complete